MLHAGIDYILEPFAKYQREAVELRGEVPKELHLKHIRTYDGPFRGHGAETVVPCRAASRIRAIGLLHSLTQTAERNSSPSRPPCSGMSF